MMEDWNASLFVQRELKRIWPPTQQLQGVNLKEPLSVLFRCHPGFCFRQLVDTPPSSKGIERVASTAYDQG